MSLLEPVDPAEVEGETPDGVTEGDLGLGTLPAIIRRLHEDRATGVLRVHVDAVERRVYFKWGDVIFANSDRREDRLDRRLLAEEALTSKALADAYEEQKRTGARFGECLVAMGALTEAELLAAVERQVRSILEVLFSTSRGQYRFEPGDEALDDDLMLDLPMQEILLDGVRSIDDPLALRIGVGRLTHLLHPRRGRRESAPSVNVSEGFILSRMDGETSILELLSVSPLTELETLRSVYALLAVGLVEAREREPAPEPVPRPRPRPVSEPEPSVMKTPAPEPPKARSEPARPPNERPPASSRFDEEVSALTRAALDPTPSRTEPKPRRAGVLSRLASLFGRRS